jgi:hypothetical protein
MDWINPAQVVIGSYEHGNEPSCSTKKKDERLLLLS